MIKFILGIQGYILSDDEKAIFTQMRPLGFILFTRNMQSKDQLIALTNSLKELCGQDTLIFTDQEGGVVSRLESSGLVPKGSYKSSRDIYDIYKKFGLQEAQKQVEANYFKMGEDLKTFGLNGTFAPVADLLYPGADPIIGTRSFGSYLDKPDVVIALCGSAMDGLDRAGVFGCIKHMPGHGLAQVDSHKALPFVDKDLTFLEQNDFRVFKELAPRAKFAMTAHIVYKCLDDRLPVSLSELAIRYIRSKEGIDFQGNIITDDICMGALSKNLVQNACQASSAGVDVILCCNATLDQLRELSNLNTAA